MRALPLLSIALAISLAALTSGCEPGLQTYWTETQAQAACGDDEVVFGQFDAKAGLWFYVTKGSKGGWTNYGGDYMHHGQYACLKEMARNRVPCARGGGGKCPSPAPSSSAPSARRETTTPALIGAKDVEPSPAEHRSEAAS
jgi:hypothetical protein